MSATTLGGTRRAGLRAASRPPARRPRAMLVAGLLSGAALASAHGPACADQGGVPFWLPGQFSSFAAVPDAPGWSVVVLPYLYSGDSSGRRAFPSGLQVSDKLSAQIAYLVTQIDYAPEEKAFGGQLSFGLGFFPGWSGAQATAAAALGQVSGQRSFSQTISGFGDLYPVASLAWNRGANNFKAYVTGDIPVGAYNAANLVNLGVGHGAVDVGGAYTYFDPRSKHEVSATVGATFNFADPSTRYTNGVDLHLDWAASQMLAERWNVGLVGYVYEQVSPDRYPTAGAIGRARTALLGNFKSGVASVGPEIGYFFPVGKKQAYFNVRGYWEFWAQNRVRGEAFFATLKLPLGD